MEKKTERAPHPFKTQADIDRLVRAGLWGPAEAVELERRRKAGEWPDVSAEAGFITIDPVDIGFGYAVDIDPNSRTFGWLLIRGAERQWVTTRKAAQNEIEQARHLHANPRCPTCAGTGMLYSGDVEIGTRPCDACQTCPRCHLVTCSPECIEAEEREVQADTTPGPRKYA